MQTNKRKNQQRISNQLPNQVVAENNKTTYLPFHTCVQQSPVCLIKDHSAPCIHKNCLRAYKHPEWAGISVSEFYMQRDFNQFEVRIDSDPRMKGHEHIIPKNPNPGGKDGFEGFRQSMNAVINIADEWPNDVKFVEREHVEFRWTEFLDTYPYTNPETFQTVWLERLDVQEYAYYIGPVHMTMATYRAGIKGGV